MYRNEQKISKVTQKKNSQRAQFVGTKFFTSNMFGDASVAIPHDQAIIPYVDVISDLAQVIDFANVLKDVFYKKGGAIWNIVRQQHQLGWNL